MFGIIRTGLSLLGGNLVGKIFGNKEAREQAAAEQDTGAQEQYAAEFRETRNWFDSLVDGINRLVRPTWAFLILWLFIWPLYDIPSFVAAMNAYTQFPEWLAGIVLIVLTFYFGGRMLAKDLKVGQGISVKKFQEFQARQKELEASAASSVPVVHEKPYEIDRPSEGEYQKAMKSNKPLSLPAIVEWNRRNNPDYKP